jgi:hypothetical protein
MCAYVKSPVAATPDMGIVKGNIRQYLAPADGGTAGPQPAQVLDVNLGINQPGTAVDLHVAFPGSDVPGESSVLWPCLAPEFVLPARIVKDIGIGNQSASEMLDEDEWLGTLHDDDIVLEHYMLRIYTLSVPHHPQGRLSVLGHIEKGIVLESNVRGRVRA